MTDVLKKFTQHDVYHMGIIVKDIESGVKLWSETYGAGPFHLFIVDHEYMFRGDLVKFREYSAFGKFGRFMIELQKFEFETPNSELEEIMGIHNVNGISHYGFITDNPAEASEHLEKMGFPCFISNKTEDSEFYWHDAREQLGHYIDISLASPYVNRFHKAVELEALHWDGTEALRLDMPKGL